MFNFTEDLGIRGHLTISKVFDDGSSEVVFDDHNVIVSGMGLGLAHMFSLSGSTSILDYQIDRFQVGVSGTPALETYTTNALAGPLESASEYGDSAAMMVVSSYHAVTYETYTGPEWFGYIPSHKVTRIGTNSVRYTLTLDKEAANDLTRDSNSVALNEIGLFMKNPMGNKFALGDDASVLVAYRNFSDITKTSEFALVFRWTISL